MRRALVVTALITAALVLAALPAVSAMHVYTVLSKDNASKNDNGSVVSFLDSYSTMTCDAVAYGDNLTALGVHVEGNLGKYWDNGTTAWDNTSMGSCQFTAAQLTNKLCSFQTTDRPVNIMRGVVDNVTKTGAYNVRIYCGGVK